MPDPATMDPAWSDAHASAAAAEGWGIFECRASDPWQLQHSDCADDGEQQLVSDAQAWAIVRGGTGEHHAAALAFIQAHSPREFAAITAAAGSRATA